MRAARDKVANESVLTPTQCMTVYADIGAVVFALPQVPWHVVDFDVDRNRQHLHRLHQRLQRDGQLVTRGSSHLLAAAPPQALAGEQHIHRHG